jgi:hypothetical protein
MATSLFLKILSLEGDQVTRKVVKSIKQDTGNKTISYQ